MWNVFNDNLTDEIIFYFNIFLRWNGSYYGCCYHYFTKYNTLVRTKNSILRLKSRLKWIGIWAWKSKLNVISKVS